MDYDIAFIKSQAQCLKVMGSIFLNDSLFLYTNHNFNLEILVAIKYPRFKFHY